MIFPNEPILAEGGDAVIPAQSELIEKARSCRAMGLVLSTLPRRKNASLEDYLIVAEQEGRSEFSPAILGQPFRIGRAYAAEIWHR